MRGTRARGVPGYLGRWPACLMGFGPVRNTQFVFYVIYIFGVTG